ncbi:phospholipase D-like domain-containing protein [Aquibacillus rhizosphaerae]|uniref:Phospholipase D-like domain-containing protein n=1 Tax=Aquibacillus rhizosphaerae TaxID=3051431 RepID=A0ABT7L8U5_9BACI|nr:phospholipase D-like domain-containing protein [Aquibacillus sp. LR5S19]MDL4842289.1 hypothetical protein [Aquibacillus sp. LR5S19]
MEIITDNLYQRLETELENINTSIFIISPYIKVHAVDRLLKILKAKKLDSKLVTRTPSIDFITGASDFEALTQLHESGVQVRMIDSLHTNVCLFDNKKLYIGSGGLMDIGSDYPKNMIISQDVEKDDVETIYKEYWNHSEVKEFSSYKTLEVDILRVKEKYNSVQNQLKNAQLDLSMLLETSPFDLFLTNLRQKNIIDTYNQVCDFVFKLNNNQLVYLMKSNGNQNDAFCFEISQKVARLFKEQKIRALILILKESGTFVCLPYSLVANKILKRSNQAGNGDWNFEIIYKQKEVLLSIRQKELPIGQYVGGINFRIKAKKI